MIDTESYLDEQIAFRQEMLEKLSLIYNKTHKEIRKHEIMLDYYKRQKQQQ